MLTPPSHQRPPACQICGAFAGNQVLCGECQSAGVQPDAAAEDQAAHRARLLALDARLTDFDARIAAFQACLKSIDDRNAPAQRTGPAGLPAIAGEGAVVERLRRLGSRRITIQVPPGDGSAARWARYFTTLFLRADWTPQTEHSAAAGKSGRGFFLAAGPQSSTPDVRATYLALAAGGLKFDALLDPNLDSAHPVLIIGAGTRCEH